ncbi:hypothetical protein B0H16DRAFT_1469971 [Mycena metata]|uniref:Uncharacterized protein n=1 Tax=Mycena metata TaxID=1033252 RepID=A0AAD7HW43_9AGAR|nr:hypothetical protein B0H16DRAFT_1469971 [Mycena metata]
MCPIDPQYNLQLAVLEAKEEVRVDSLLWCRKSLRELWKKLEATLSTDLPFQSDSSLLKGRTVHQTHRKVVIDVFGNRLNTDRWLTWQITRADNNPLPADPAVIRRHFWSLEHKRANILFVNIVLVTAIITGHSGSWPKLGWTNWEVNPDQLRYCRDADGPCGHENPVSLLYLTLYHPPPYSDISCGPYPSLDDTWDIRGKASQRRARKLQNSRAKPKDAREIGARSQQRRAK